ncbi:MAG: hypothetical protein KY461_07410, partial [Actinobacteria bacterium]|nr:hypothetical protein [Actinomycetota bacterium]
DGDAPAHVLYCAHWMEPHPDFDDGGLLAVSYYDRGTRFVQVDDQGVMTEIAWIVPAEGYSGSVQWIGSDGAGGEIAYIMDYRRGMEVVNLRPADPASAALTSQLDLVAASATVTPLGTTPDGGIPVPSALVAGFGLALAGVEVLRRRRVRAGA